MRGAFCISLKLRKRGGIIGLSFVLRLFFFFLQGISLRWRSSESGWARDTTHEKGKRLYQHLPGVFVFRGDISCIMMDDWSSVFLFSIFHYGSAFGSEKEREILGNLLFCFSCLWWLARKNGL